MVQLDIKDCYQNFNGEVLGDLLNLPDDVVRNVVLGYDLPFTIHHIGFHLSNGDTVLKQEPYRSVVPLVQQGIPQGSSLSPLVCEILISQIDITTCESARLVIYADNFLVLAKDEETAMLVANKLRKALSSHPAGPLTLSGGEVRIAKYCFDFLGYEFFKQGPLYSVRPSQKNFSKINRIYHIALHNLPLPVNCKQGHLKKIAKLRKTISGWSNAFHLWEGSKAYNIERLSHIAKIEQQFKEHLKSSSSE